VYFMDIWSIFSPLVYFSAIRYILWLFCICFGMSYKEKSGNPGSGLKHVVRIRCGKNLFAFVISWCVFQSFFIFKVLIPKLKQV
jgi:hypothetical protein